METIQPGFDFNESPKKAKWNEVKRKHPRLMAHLARISLELKHRGYARYSMDGVFHIARWDTGLSTGDLGFKMNNDYTAYASRELMKDYPQLEGFFQTRKQHPRNK